MDYDVVRTSVNNAYKDFGQNDDKFYSAMENFYKEGKKNPSVAKIIMKDFAGKKLQAANRMLNNVVALSFPDTPVVMYPELIGYQNQLHSVSLKAAMKSLDAEEIYKNTEYLSEDVGSEEAKDFKNVWSKLYPRTGKLRERIIDANRISMDKVNKKAGWLEKINFVKTLAEYKKDYPKTFNARYALIMNEQIIEDDVTSSVKGWFKRFSYKRLIKKGFSFKRGK